MENKQTAPKEMWVHWSDHNDLQKDANVTLRSTISNYHTKGVEEYKYLSESHVKELLAEKDKSIATLMERLKFRDEALDISGTNEIYAYMDIKKLKQELAEKEREIEQLKKQLEK